MPTALLVPGMQTITFVSGHAGDARRIRPLAGAGKERVGRWGGAQPPP